MQHMDFLGVKIIDGDVPVPFGPSPNEDVSQIGSGYDRFPLGVVRRQPIDCILQVTEIPVGVFDAVVLRVPPPNRVEFVDRRGSADDR